MELVGRVLWWSDRDQNGIIVDLDGNEFYFDRSVLKLKSNQTIRRKSVVTFSYNQSISDCICACNVRMALASKQKSAEKQFNRQSSVNL